MDVDREPRHRARCQWHVYQPQHPTLAADRRRLSPRIRLGTFKRDDCPGARIVLPGTLDQLAAAGDDRRRIAALDRGNERAVDEAKAKIGAAVPHREWRRLNQMSQGIQRSLGLLEAPRQFGALGLRPASVEQP